MHVIMLLLCALSLPLMADESDPLKSIQRHRLKNGLVVVLAPDRSGDLVHVKLRVGVGLDHETEGNFGVSHLLEHVLFRNEILKDDMSFSELIKEREGTANGETTEQETSYFATIPRRDAGWLLDNFRRMIFAPTIREKYLETEKKTVLLEIGEPGPVIRLLGFDPLRIISPSHLREKPFWEEYYGIVDLAPYSLAEEQLSTLRLTRAQLEAHYRRYYDPSNMQLTVGGAFDPAAVLARLEETWGQHPSRGTGDLRRRVKGTLRGKPFRDFAISEDTSSITLGFMVDRLDQRDREVLESYSQHLAHRLMKKIRNLSGETYTAYEKNGFYGDYGYFTINLSTSRERFRENLRYVRDLLYRELRDGGLSDDDVREAVRLYLNGFRLWGRDAEARAELADLMTELNDHFRNWVTPGELLKDVTPDEYRRILRKHARPENEYLAVAQPEIFFYRDYYLFGALLAVAFLALFRRLLLKPFRHDRVRWVRKVRFPPLLLLEVVVGGVILELFLHAEYVSVRGIDALLGTSLGIYGRYLEAAAETFLLVAVAQAVLAAVPRKLYVVDDELAIKGLSYFSRRIPLREIRSVRAVPLPAVLGRFREWRSLLGRFHYYDGRFWEPGLLVELHTGKRFYFSTRDSAAAARELGELCSGTSVGPASAGVA
jgi:zinc protease